VPLHDRSIIDRVRQAALVGVLLIALAGAFASRGDSQEQLKPTITMPPISALFEPANRQTRYGLGTVWRKRPITVSWSLSLQLVDPAGAPDPGTPGSGAAVDIGCSNAGIGTPHPVVTKVDVNRGTPEFTWHHPDAAESKPAGKYDCDHTAMGPHGHQGLIRVTISDGHWSCTETYKGTYTSSYRDVKTGTATQPKCHLVAR
jgi:hypothetical protein